jgi:hypothetical protein
LSSLASIVWQRLPIDVEVPGSCSLASSDEFPVGAGLKALLAWPL